MLVEFIRYIRGYVDFTAKGKFPERFLNITARYGINLWNSQPSPNCISASMYASDYRKIRFAAKKAGVKTKTFKKHGMPFTVRKYRGRIGIPIGAAAGAMLIVVLSNFIWSVSVKGAENISDTKIIQALESNGVRTGAYKNDIDVQKIERDIMLEIDDIGWMSVNLTGNIASVEVKEKAKKPEIKTSSSPCNIKAGKDGVITKINAKSGNVQMKKGSGVSAGDLIVSGIIETKMNTIQYVHADAEVYADVAYEKNVSIKRNYDYTSPSKDQTFRREGFLLWFKFPLNISFSSYEKFVFSDKTENFTVNGTVLPMGVKTSVQSDLVTVKKTPDKSDAEQIFINDLLLYEAFEKSKSTLVSRKVSIAQKNDEYLCKASYVFNENIAVSEEFSVTD